MGKRSILIVEDEELMRNILRRLLEAEGYSVFTADSAEAGLRVFAENEIAVTVTDIKMAGMDGLTMLDHIKAIDEHALIVVMTAFSSVDSAIAALRKGAYDYITKPFLNDDILKTIRNALAQDELFRQNRALRRELYREYNFAEMIGSGPAFRGVLEMVQKVADTNSTVLIRGESGTGKELIARALHFNSRRSDRPFLAVNCGALPDSLLESELFGHVRGAFTGAVGDKKGFFRSAEGGTVFLDEVGEMTAALQVKLLRAVQEHEVTPVGASAAVGFDARIVAATHKDLASEVREGRFREDLFYRLNVIEIVVPPLRERREDIAALAKHFALKSATKQNSPRKAVTDEALNALAEYDWPGNIRELENVIERAFILSDGEITLADLPPAVSKNFSGTEMGGIKTLDEVEREHILQTLESLGQDKSAAAAALGIDLSTLYRKLKRYES